ncbi:hypothetical protein NPIL_666621 [Nephila pilipes]|uniref:Uncharacterized protein n=1 Tax=Nephila pilipes TaxID=299642 RepID=A0A8X6NJU0_NEPPI|nr:hypothetical protein NPIL_666621 [Nephila pilipes]
MDKVVRRLLRQLGVKGLRQLAGWSVFQPWLVGACSGVSASAGTHLDGFRAAALRDLSSLCTSGAQIRPIMMNYSSELGSQVCQQLRETHYPPSLTIKQEKSDIVLTICMVNQTNDGDRVSSRSCTCGSSSQMNVGMEMTFTLMETLQSILTRL